MSGGARRLERLYPALTGKEAAKLDLANYKAHRPYDSLVANALQSGQIVEYNHLVGIMNLVNGELADVMLVVREQVTQQALRLAWLSEMSERAQDAWIVRRFLDECTREPITESELAKRKKKPPTQGFDVRPDDDADEVELLRKNRELITVLLDRHAVELKLPLDLPEDGEEVRTDEPLGLARLLAATMQGGLEACWTQLQAVRITIDEYAEDGSRSRRRRRVRRRAIGERSRAYADG